MSGARLALLVQLGTTLPLVGLIWLVQVVSYPLFLRVGEASFVPYHAAHARHINVVVGPLMMAELIGALAWIALPTDDAPTWVRVVGASLVLLTWIVTFALAVPRHEVLGRGFDGAVIASLVSVNWLRTAAWTARGALVLWTVARHG